MNNLASVLKKQCENEEIRLQILKTYDIIRKINNMVNCEVQDIEFVYRKFLKEIHRLVILCVLKY